MGAGQSYGLPKQPTNTPGAGDELDIILMESLREVLGQSEAMNTPRPILEAQVAKAEAFVSETNDALRSSGWAGVSVFRESDLVYIKGSETHAERLKIERWLAVRANEAGVEIFRD